MTVIKKLVVIVGAVLVTVVLAGCGGNDASARTRVAPNGERFNDADVTFATDMVKHHAQALLMVDMTMSRSVDPQVQQLADEILATKGLEVEEMTRWLTTWRRPIPDTVRDHSHADGGGDDVDMRGIPGVLTSEQMSALQNAESGTFQTLWLQLMIAHHEGAVEMARTELSDGYAKSAVELAKAIETSQREQIAAMKRLLAS